jgi:hypothetical protein
MKYVLNIVCLLILAMGLWSCRDDDRVRHPEFVEGANMRIVTSTVNSKLLLSKDDSRVDIDAYSINKNLSVVEFYGFLFRPKAGGALDTIIKDKFVFTIPASAFVNGKASGSFTLSDVKKGMGADFVSKFKTGDRLVMFTETTLNDGRRIEWANIGPSIQQGANASYSASWQVKVDP